MIRVLIVDDSAFVRQALTRMLGNAADIEVVATAVDGKDGWEKALDFRPDVVTLDVKMPRMDGLEALRRIMADCPTAVLLLSSQTKEGAEVTLRGLELGAMDFVDKSRVQGHMNLLSLAEELQAKVRALASVPRSRLHVPAAVRETGPKTLPAQHAARAQIVVIGTSTGGPPALQAIIPRLPEALPCPVRRVGRLLRRKPTPDPARSESLRGSSDRVKAVGSVAQESTGSSGPPRSHQPSRCLCLR